MAGLLRTQRDMREESLELLVDMACAHQAPAYLLVGNKQEDRFILQERINKVKNQKYSYISCAEIWIEREPTVVSTPYDDRIHRIEMARDYKRKRLGELLQRNTDIKTDDDLKIIIVDFDLKSVPTASQVVQVATRMTTDVLCAHGLSYESPTNQKDSSLAYYDTFATILLPDTFVYPIKGRMVPKVRPQENRSLIVNEEEFSGHDLYMWVHEQGYATTSKHTFGTVRPVLVNSCFGGLAIYRAKIWFDARCSYRRQNAQDCEEYANKYDKKPCEHVVFHNCLHKTLSSDELSHNLTVAIQPDLYTFWNQDELFPSVGEYITRRGLRAITTSSKAPKSTKSPKAFNSTLSSKSPKSLNATRRDLRAIPPSSKAPKASNATLSTKTPKASNATLSSKTPKASKAPRRHLQANDKFNVHRSQNLIDFALLGFPKTGSTSLLHSLANHENVEMVQEEYCDLSMQTVTDAQAEKSLKAALSDLSNTLSYRGFKCPNALRDPFTLNRLEQHSPNARIVVGVRHPVWFFESYYNYRVTEWYNLGHDAKEIPKPEALMGTKAWKGVSTHTARFEYFLSQFSLSSSASLTPVPSMIVTRFEVFIFALEQMYGEEMIERKQAFETQMSSFLELDEPIHMLHENKNAVIYPESMNICESKYDNLRAVLVANGKKSQEWISNVFIPAVGVTVNEKEHFLEAIKKWAVDPCLEKSLSSPKYSK